MTLLSALASGATGWVAVDVPTALLVIAASVCILLGYLCGVMVMRIGDVSFIAPFRYTGLVWALVLGWAVFGDWPQVPTLAGAAIVVSTGLFTLFRERALLRR